MRSWIRPRAGLTLPRPSSSALEFNKSAVNRGRKCLAPRLLETCRHLKIPSSRFCSLLLNEQPSGPLRDPAGRFTTSQGGTVSGLEVSTILFFVTQRTAVRAALRPGRSIHDHAGRDGLWTRSKYGIVPYYSKNSRPGRFATRPVNSRPRRAGKNVSRHLARLDSSRVTLSCDHRA